MRQYTKIRGYGLADIPVRLPTFLFTCPLSRLEADVGGELFCMAVQVQDHLGDPLCSLPTLGVFRSLRVLGFFCAALDWALKIRGQAAWPDDSPS